MKGVSILVMALLVLTGAACGTQRDAGQASSQTLTTSASGTPKGDVDALMAEAKQLIDETNDLGLELWEGQMFEVVTAENAAAAEPQLAKARTLLDSMEANQKSVVALLEQVVRLDGSDELRTYAGQQAELAELHLLGIAQEKDLLAGIERMYEEKGKIDQAHLEDLLRATEPISPDDPLAHLEEKGHASIEYFRRSGLAERYYINNGLGEAYDAPEGLPESEGWETPFTTADGIELWVADPLEDGAWRMQGAFAGPLEAAVGAQRSLLEREGWSVEIGTATETRVVMTARKSPYTATFTFKRTDPGKDGKLVVRLTGI